MWFGLHFSQYKKKSGSCCGGSSHGHHHQHEGHSCATCPDKDKKEAKLKIIEVDHLH